MSSRWASVFQEGMFLLQYLPVFEGQIEIVTTERYNWQVKVVLDECC